MGARFRLRSGFDISHFGPYVQVVLRAMKHYGLILADNGSDWYFQGSVDHHWTYSFVDQLKQIPAGAFVAVDESACKVGPNTGRFAYGPKCPAPCDSRSSARKLPTRAGPSGVRMLSGWNCTPNRGNSRCWVAITSPSSVQAVSSSSSGRSSRCHHQRVVAASLERIAHALEDPMALVEHERGLAVDGCGAIHRPPVLDADRLMAQAHPQDGCRVGKDLQQVGEASRRLGSPGARREDHGRGCPSRQRLGRLSVALHDLGRVAEALDQLHEVVGERVVVIDDEDHRAGPPRRRA